MKNALLLLLAVAAIAGVQSAAQQAGAGMSEAQSRFYGFSGGWGGYTANARGKTITFKPGWRPARDHLSSRPHS
jgi:hypothetical protein